MARTRLLGAALVTVLAASVAAAQPSAATAAIPSVRTISPTAGPLRGGNALTVSGTKLFDVTAVVFGSVVARRITHVSGTLLRVRVPKHTAGTVAVRLVSQEGSSRRTSSARYRFTRAPNALRWGGLHRIDPTRGSLASVSCGSPTFCVAVDSRWNARDQLVRFAPGERGVAVASPLKNVSGLACASATYCVAGQPASVTEWDGSSWGPTHRLANWSYADSISCAPQSSLCVMLGNDSSLVHDAGGWHTVAVPFAGRFLVSCPTATFCLATDGKRTMRFDGTSWTTLTRNYDPPDYLEGLSCASADYCLATGYDSGFEWTPAGWSSVPPNVLFDDVGAPSCIADSDCLLFDSYSAAQRWDGRALHEVGMPRGAMYPSQPSCLPSLGCVFVDQGGNQVRLTAAHAWTRLREVVPAQGWLSSVSCASGISCVAVDSPGNALTWNGSHWSAPTRIDSAGTLTSISCASRSFCAAVGTHAVLRVGGRWRSPVRVDARPLVDVDCPTAVFCIAVDNGGRAVIWRAHGWSAPAKVTGQALDAVSCSDADHCLAVGYRSAQWNGRHWTPVANPAHAYEVSDVDCVTATFCVAGGVHGFYVRHDSLWSQPVRPDPYIDDAWVSCMSARYCLGEDDIAEATDVEDYVFDGAAVHSRDYQTGGYTSCSPTLCASVDGDTVDIGRR